MNDSKTSRKKIPPPVLSKDPEAELEEKLREDPNDQSVKVDVGSDESMDASDPVSIARPDQEDPVPSSGYPDDEEDEDDQR